MFSYRRLAAVASVVVVTISVSSRTASADSNVAPRTVTDSYPAHHGAIFIDPLGFLLFGPRLGIEGGTGHIGAAVYGRWFNAGLLSKTLFLNEGDEFRFSYGGGVRGRYYPRDGLVGFHVGAQFEYIWVRIERPAAFVLTTSQYAVPQLEVGYRLGGARFFADGSASAGYAIQVSGSVEDVAGGNNASLYSAEDKSAVYGSANLEFGFYF